MSSRSNVKEKSLKKAQHSVDFVVTFDGNVMEIERRGRNKKRMAKTKAIKGKWDLLWSGRTSRILVGLRSSHNA